MAFAAKFRTIQPWLSAAVRLVIAGFLLFASIPKLMDLPSSVRAVRAYELLPEAIVPVVGNALPFVQLALAVLLVAGAFTRLASIGWLVLITGFTIGIIWAWANGLQIDCGCFSEGGALPEGETANYPARLAERAGFLALGTYLMIYPRSRFSLDSWMSPKA